MKIIILKTLKLYQIIASPFLHRFIPAAGCRFYPTCSEYSYEAVSRYGILKGCVKSIWRVLRCNPLSKGGIDPT